MPMRSLTSINYVIFNTLGAWGPGGGLRGEGHGGADVEGMYT
jgi:hypothetical protein